MSATTLDALPLELLIDSLLPWLELRDLLALARTCRFFALVCSDDTFWKRKTAEEYNFSGAGSARTSGFKHLYRGLRKPRVFVWGESNNDRLALSKRKHNSGSNYGAVEFPVELELHRRVVHLAAGGWSFHALTDDGRVLVWGELDSTGWGSGTDNLAYSATTVRDPVALILPQKIKSLSAGRRHAVLLDARNEVWVLLAWGRPARLVAPVFNGSEPESTVVQVEAGWDVCAFLTQTGDAYVVFPFHGSFDAEAEAHIPRPNAPGVQREIVRRGDELPCECWDVEHHPTKLPPLPANLPVLHPKTDAEAKEAPPKLVKIAAGDHFVVGLTDGGHVLKLDLPADNETGLRQLITRGDLQWDYLPKFCDLSQVREEPGFKPQGQESTLDSLTVTHISAQFRTFVVYSTTGSSVVLLGSDVTSSQRSAAPKVIPELQNRNVISVVLGDYHYCALTVNGELFSWGQYSNGALGLGSPGGSAPAPRFRFNMPPMLHRPAQPPRPRDAAVPTRVTFDHEDGVQDRYVFAVAAAGWHCGALVIDLHSSSSASAEAPQHEDQLMKPDQASANEEMEEHTRSDAEAGASQPIAALPHRTEGERATQIPQISLPIVRGRGHAPFRIGYAARGAYAGRGRGGFANSNSGSGTGDGANPGRAER